MTTLQQAKHSPVAPALKALIAQSMGFAATLLIAVVTGGLPLFGCAFTVTQGVISAATAAVLRSARWWLGIHLAFAPALLAASKLQIAPGWYLGAFVALVLVYWTSFRTQVPLYLSSRRTADALLELMAPHRPVTLIDLGSGSGGLLRRLAQARPDSRCVGIEAAPLPLLISRCLKRPANVDLRWGDFWAEPLGGYDLVYAFLSPVPMTRLWDKARREMARDSVLVSNSFAVPGITPTRIIEVADRRHTRLYCYQMYPE